MMHKQCKIANYITERNGEAISFETIVVLCDI